MSSAAIYEAVARALPPAHMAMWEAAELQAVLESDGRLVLSGDDVEALRAIVATSGANLARELVGAGLGITAVVTVDPAGASTELRAERGGLPTQASLADREVSPGEVCAALKQPRTFRMPTARCHHPIFDVNDARSYSPSQPLTFRGYPGRASCDYTRTRLTVRVELAIAQLLGVCRVRDGQPWASLNQLGWATWGRKMCRDEPARLIDELYSILTGSIRYDEIGAQPRRPGEAQPAYDARVRAFRRAHQIAGPLVEELELVCADGEVVSLRDLYDPQAPTRLRRPLSNRALTMRVTPSLDLAAALSAPVTQLGALFTLVESSAVNAQSRSTPAYLRALAAPARPHGGKDARKFGLLSASELAEWGEQRAAAANSDGATNRGARREAIDRIAEDLSEVCRTAPLRFGRLVEEHAHASWRVLWLRLTRKPQGARTAKRELSRARYRRLRDGAHGPQPVPPGARARHWVRQARLRGDTPQRARLRVGVDVDAAATRTSRVLPLARDDIAAP